MSLPRTTSTTNSSNDIIAGWKNLTDETEFQSEVLESAEVVIIEFFRNDCSSCRMFEPTLRELADRYQGKFKFVRLNTGNGSYFREKYGFAGEPTTAVFYRGNLVGFVLGASGFDIYEPQLLKITAQLSQQFNLPPLTRTR